MLETEIFSDFDGIFGCNILKPLEAKIDLKENLLITKIPLVYESSTIEYNENDKSYLETTVIGVNFNEPKIANLTEKLKTDNLNNQGIDELTKSIRNFKNVFYIEGDNLSAVIKYRHRIPTINDISVYSKTYRFHKYTGVRLKDR